MSEVWGRRGLGLRLRVRSWLGRWGHLIGSLVWSIAFLGLIAAVPFEIWVGEHLGFQFSPVYFSQNVQLDARQMIVVVAAEAAGLAWIGTLVAAMLAWRIPVYRRWLAHQAVWRILVYRTLYSTFAWSIASLVNGWTHPGDASSGYVGTSLGGALYFFLLSGFFTGAAWFLPEPPPEPPITMLSREELQAIAQHGSATPSSAEDSTGERAHPC